MNILQRLKLVPSVVAVGTEPPLKEPGGIHAYVWTLPGGLEAPLYGYRSVESKLVVVDLTARPTVNRLDGSVNYHQDTLINVFNQVTRINGFEVNADHQGEYLVEGAFWLDPPTQPPRFDADQKQFVAQVRFRCLVGRV